MTCFIILYGLLGTAMGGLLNIPLDRLPRGQSLRGRPRCATCGQGFAAGDMIPLLGYLRLRGRCRACDTRISARAPLTELAGGLLLALLARLYGPTAQLALKSVYSAILLFLFLYDLENKKILNVVIYPATGLALVATLLQTLIGFERFPPLRPAWGFVQAMAPVLAARPETVWTRLLGGAFAFGVFLGLWLISPNFAAEGDVKMALFAGLIVGYPAALIAVFGSFLLSGTVAGLLLLTRRVTRKTALPFAPFLSMATFLALL